MFYFDDILKRYEKEYSWDKALMYLEKLFEAQARIEILNSLIGFSWLYLVEGPLVSKKYGEDESQLPFSYWKKYLSIGFSQYKDDPCFCFVAGYTLLLDGDVYMEECRTKNMPSGLTLLEKAIEMGNYNVATLAKCIVNIEKNKKCKSCKVNKDILSELFPNESLLESVFQECYT